MRYLTIMTLVRKHWRVTPAIMALVRNIAGITPTIAALVRKHCRHFSNNLNDDLGTSKKHCMRYSNIVALMKEHCMALTRKHHMHYPDNHGNDEKTLHGLL